jgi:hypothetical protein
MGLRGVLSTITENPLSNEICTLYLFTFSFVLPMFCSVLYHFDQFGSHASRTSSRALNSHGHHADFGLVPKKFNKVQKSLKNAIFSGRNKKFSAIFFLFNYTTI